MILHKTFKILENPRKICRFDKKKSFLKRNLMGLWIEKDFFVVIGSFSSNLGPSLNDRFQMTLVESPPDFVQVHWEMDLDISSFSAYQFDLNVFNTTSQENTLFENIKGEYLCTWSAELSKSDLHTKNVRLLP